MQRWWECTCSRWIPVTDTALNEPESAGPSHSCCPREICPDSTVPDNTEPTPLTSKV